MMMLDDLDMTGSVARRDAITTLSFFPLEALERLRLAQEENRLLKNRYNDVEGRGCLMYFLGGGEITSKATLLAYPFGDTGTLLAARRLVRHWDAGALGEEELRAILADTIAQRREANRLEDAAVLTSQALVETMV